MSQSPLSVDTQNAADVSVELSDGTDAVDVVTDGSGAGTKGLHVLGTDGTNAQILNVDSDGHLQVDIVGGSEAVSQFTEDSAHSSGDEGTMTLAVRNDTLAALAGSDGDYAPHQVNANGALYVDVTDSEPLDVSAATVTVTDDGSFNATVSQSTHDNLNANANLQVGDTDVSDSNPVPVTILDEPGTVTAQASFATATGVSPGATSDIDSSVISSGVTGRLKAAHVSADVAFIATVKKFDGTTETTVGELRGAPGDAPTFEPANPEASLFEQAGDGTSTVFRVTFTNDEETGGNNGAMSVTFEYDEEA